MHCLDMFSAGIEKEGYGCTTTDYKEKWGEKSDLHFGNFSASPQHDLTFMSYQYGRLPKLFHILAKLDKCTYLKPLCTDDYCLSCL